MPEYELVETSSLGEAGDTISQSSYDMLAPALQKYYRPVDERKRRLEEKEEWRDKTDNFPYGLYNEPETEIPVFESQERDYDDLDFGGGESGGGGAGGDWGDSSSDSSSDSGSSSDD
jgi:hypothetical protein